MVIKLNPAFFRSQIILTRDQQINKKARLPIKPCLKKRLQKLIVCIVTYKTLVASLYRTDVHVFGNISLIQIILRITGAYTQEPCFLVIQNTRNKFPLKKSELETVKIITRTEPFPLDKVKISLYHFFKPVADTILRGKNKERKSSETYYRNGDKFCIDRFQEERFDHCIEKISKKKSNDKL
jgi:hypothetical protein